MPEPTYSALSLTVKLFFLGSCLALNLVANAHQPSDGLIHGAVGPLMSQGYDPTHPFEAPVYGGFGLLAEADLNAHGGVELAIHHLHQTFSIERRSQRLIERGRRLYVSMGYRRWFSRNFSVAAAFFSSYLMGDALTLRNDFNLANPPKTSARDIVEYGFDLSLQQEVYRHDKYAVLVDGRYSHSVTPKPDEESNHYTVMLAFKFFIQSSQPESDLEL